MNASASSTIAPAANRVQPIADNLWIFRFPLSLLGIPIGRTVTALRLASGRLVIHSTAPFARADIEALRMLGEPSWLVEATLMHDTFAAAGRQAFPSLPYLTPSTLKALPVPSAPLTPAPAEWNGELAVLELEGMPSVREHAFLHRPTRTLIVADFVFNFGPDSSRLTRSFFRWGGGIRAFPGVSRYFRFCIRDRAAFARSVQRLMQWDFDRVIVGHGEVIESSAKAKLADALASCGF